LPSPRLTTRIVAVALAATTIGACGSASNHGSAPAPAPRKLTLVTSGGRADAAIYPQRLTDYVLDGTLPDLGAQAPVRRLVSHDVTAADVARMAGALGMHAAPTRTSTGYEVHDGDAVLTVNTAGGVTSVGYSGTGGAGISIGGSAGSGSASSSTGEAVPPDAGGPATDPPPIVAKPPGVDPSVTSPSTTIPNPVDVPSASDAADIAQSLLDSFGVLAGEKWAHDVTAANGVAFSCAAGETCTDTPAPPVTARTVTYELLVDGARVLGIDWSVTIGAHRRVESVSGTWASAGDASPYALRSTKDVFDDLQHGRAQYAGVQAMLAPGGPAIAPGTVLGTAPDTVPPLEVHITGVALGSARWDGTDNGQAVVYVVPTYRFHARVGQFDPYDVELLALDPGTFAIASPSVPKGSPTPAGVVPEPPPAPKPPA
jgi:hypothetical protein